MVIFLIVIFASILLTSQTAERYSVISTSETKTLERIAFGSCYHFADEYSNIKVEEPNTTNPSFIWDVVSSFNPSRIVLLGDQIYVDRGKEFYNRIKVLFHLYEDDFETHTSCWIL